jgi:16S rRNA (cytidine1402-2'-O)-methyltransferase
VVSFGCHGHANIAGTHDKTVEFTRDADISRRATCVLGLASDHDDDALLALRGRVEVTLECKGLRDTFEATITPFFVGDDSLVLRCGRPLRERSLAGDASKSAADIDRDLVRALADPGAHLNVSITETGRGRDRGAGALFVVAVPIGNDDDLSPRARRVLGAADLVLAEDTRRFRDLVQRTGVALRAGADVVSYHDHNEDARAHEAIARLHEGARVALVTDAGTPLCSDPGYVVVTRAVTEDIGVVPVPGPSSLLAVLSASGLPVDRFSYVGFVARRSAARQRELAALGERGDTFVLHEAPHRVAGLLADLAVVGPDWQCCIGREVTKIFEEFRYGTAAELARALADEEPRGEFTIAVSPAAVEKHDDAKFDAVARALLADGVTPKTVAHALAQLPGVSRKEAYARVLALAERR